MKKIFFTLSLLLAVSLSTVEAQEDVKVRFGVTAGFGMTKWNGDYSSDFGTSFKPGFRLGGVAEMMLTPKWSVQPELLFSYEGTGTDALGDANAMYIKLPILAYYNFQNIGPGQLSPGVGPYFAGGIGGKCDGESTLGYDGLAEKFDWGIQIRAAYELQTLGVANLNGMYGFVGYEQGFTKTYNMGLLVGVGYKFQYNKWLKSAYNKGIFKYD